MLMDYIFSNRICIACGTAVDWPMYFFSGRCLLKVDGNDNIDFFLLMYVTNQMVVFWICLN